MIIKGYKINKIGDKYFWIFIGFFLITTFCGILLCMAFSHMGFIGYVPGILICLGCGGGMSYFIFDDLTKIISLKYKITENKNGRCLAYSLSLGVFGIPYWSRLTNEYSTSEYQNLFGATFEITNSHPKSVAYKEALAKIAYEKKYKKERRINFFYKEPNKTKKTYI
jgi:hypothetical protein